MFPKSTIFTFSYHEFIVAPIPDEPINVCQPSPCGANAICKERNGAGSCSCLPEYYGDPYSGCKPECVLNTDCPKTKACVNNKCVDPCPGVCGLNAECSVINHSPSCSCIPGLTGDPLRACHEPPPSKIPNLTKITIQSIEYYFTVIRDPINVCSPSPCGPYSVCREVNGHAVCSCQSDYIGSPPNCRPECIVSSECSQDKACANQRCVDPCIGSCGQNAKCQVINHNPICSCSNGYTGDPFVRCTQIESKRSKLFCLFLIWFSGSYQQICKYSFHTFSNDSCT